MQPVKLLRDPRLWGTTALAFMTVLGIVAAMVYVNPPGSKLVGFYTDDASSITPGIAVRMAGIPVGKVKELSIEPDQVRVIATVEGHAFVGDQSSVQVRMLTVVGGYYVNIDSLGDEPLGSRSIPQERVTPPYSLVRALADATDVTQSLETAPINEALDQLQTGLAGDNVNALTALVDAGTSITGILDRQQGQISSTLRLTDEWVDHLAGFEGDLRRMIDKIAILESTLVLYTKGLTHAMEGLGRLMVSLKPLGPFYQDHREDFLQKLINWQQIARSWADRSGLVTRILQRTRDRMSATLDRQNAPPELLATDLCIPIPGVSC